MTCPCLLKIGIIQGAFLADVDDGKEEDAHQVHRKEEEGGEGAARPARRGHEEGDHELEDDDDDQGLPFGKAQHQEFVVEVESVRLQYVPVFPDSPPDGREGIEDRDQ